MRKNPEELKLKKEIKIYLKFFHNGARSSTLNLLKDLFIDLECAKGNSIAKKIQKCIEYFYNENKDDRKFLAENHPFEL